MILTRAAIEATFLLRYTFLKVLLINLYEQKRVVTMTFEQLYYFCEVYRQQSFSSAAENLSVSRQSLSFSIKRLENELETILFIREVHGIRPTVSGDLFYKYAKKALLDNWEIKTLISAKSSNCTGTKIFKIGLCDYIMGTIGRELYGRLSEKFSEQYFSFSVLDANHSLETQDEYDLIFTIVNPSNFELQKNKSHNSDEWIIKYLHQYQIYVWLSKKSQYAIQNIVSFDTLKDISFCTLRNYINESKTKLNLFLGYYKMASLPVSLQLEENFADYIEKFGYATIDIKFKDDNFAFSSILKGKNIVAKSTDAEVILLAMYKNTGDDYFYQYVIDELFDICNIN